MKLQVRRRRKADALSYEYQYRLKDGLFWSRWTCVNTYQMKIDELNNRVPYSPYLDTAPTLELVRDVLVRYYGWECGEWEVSKR